MTSFERSLLMLIVYLTVFYNIERIDLGQENIVDISSVLYVVVLFILLAIFLVPFLRKVKTPVHIVLWAGFYILVRIAVSSFYDRPIWGGVYTYLTITEISLLAIAVFLACEVRKYQDDFRQALENLTLAGLSHRVQHKNEAYTDIQKEILRSRRHHYPLSAIVVEPDASSVNIALNRSVLEIQKAMMNRYATNNLMRLASNMLRRTDLIIDQVIDKDSFVILLPDTDADEASKLGTRFQELVNSKMGIRIDYGHATFPDEALTFDDLVFQADHKIQCGPPANEPASDPTPPNDPTL